MQSILEELYYGNIRPDSKVYSKDSEFVKAAHLKHDAKEKLMATLNKSEKKLFKRYCEAEGEIDSITRYDIFTYTLKFGVLFMTEIFMAESE